MGRLIGIDYGTKRVGIAVSDPLKMIAGGLATVGAHEILDFIGEYLKKEAVDGIVVGVPKRLNNTASEAFVYTEQFITALSRRFPQIPVYEVDERFTSSLAADAMLRGGMKKKDRQVKGNLDRISAAIILQSFIDSGRGK